MYRYDYNTASKVDQEEDVAEDNSQNQSQLFRDQKSIMASNATLSSDLARLEAKLDILLNLAYTSANQVKLSPHVNEKISPAELSLLRNMTAKQHVTAQLLVEGWSNKDIAHVLGIGENTVKLHVRAVCKKVGTKTRGQAALVFRDIMSSVEPSEYQRSSGGLPVDWGTSHAMDSKDPYEKIYRKD